MKEEGISEGERKTRKKETERGERQGIISNASVLSALKPAILSGQKT